jgi:hypothetical protein
MRVIHHPHAEAELVEAARYYDRQVPGLGAEFLDAVDGAVAEILDAPERWPIEEGEVRHFLLERFPYAIHYRILPDELRVIAFKHHSRHPDYWRYRPKTDAIPPEGAHRKPAQFVARAVSGTDARLSGVQVSGYRGKTGLTSILYTLTYFSFVRFALRAFR